MHNILFLFLLSTSYIFSNINAVVSILPQQSFLKAIGGDKVNITLMVAPGNSPHTYEPKPSQMVAVATADLYLAMGVEFENVWLAKFQNLNPKMHIVNLAQGIEKIAMIHHHTHDDNHTHLYTSKDPHIWTSPKNVKSIAHNIYHALCTLDKDNTKYYENNLNTFLAHVEQTDKQIRTILFSLKDKRHFMVFHPSWGYFAKAYGLEQIAVEVEGKSPKPKELVHLIQEAKEEHVLAIFTQPEFSDASAKIIAHELRIPVVKITPMAKEWSKNLIFMAHTIAGK